MGSLKYAKMSLFDAPKGSILVHGCNAQGVWGSGIAVPFKANHPRAFKQYSEYCQTALRINPKYGAVGKAVLSEEENGHRVGCLITSTNYGPKRDSPGQITMQTILALRDFIGYLNSYQLLSEPIYSNKFNSGLFNVPWQHTENVLRYITDRYDINWVVCDPNL